MIRAENLGFEIGGRSIFSNLNFTLKKGEKKRLIGRNGSGKSSLLGILQGFILPSKGSLLKEDNIQSAYLFQESLHQFIAPTVLEDVAFSLIAKEKKSQQEALRLAYTMLERLGIEHLEHHSIFSLSGGEKRLVAIAGVLVLECDIFLLDEPFNELDEKRREILKQIINERDCAFLIADHQNLDWENVIEL